MIIPILQGGLGNQMFQISTAYSLARDNNDEVAINYNIQHIGLQKSQLYYKDNIFKKIKSTDVFPAFKYNEPFFNFKQIPYDNNMCIHGYFQSEKYFEKYKKEINTIFEFPKSVKDKVDNFLGKFKNVYKVGIHYRRGDYIQYKNIYNCLGEDYYKKAKKIISKKKLVYLNCSDDFNNVLNEFAVEGEIIKFGSELEDLYMLSQCDSIIMSNSSFSWWGSWLGKNKDVIVMPKNWFGPGGEKHYEDIYIKESLII